MRHDVRLLSVAALAALIGCSDRSHAPREMGSSRAALQGMSLGAEKSYPSGESGPPTYVQGPSAIAFDGSKFLVVWFERNAVLGRFVDLIGQPQGSVFEVAVGPVDGWRAPPTLAWSGSVYLVAWHSWTSAGSVIRTARILPDGTVLDVEEIELGATHPWLYLAVTATSSGILMVWTRQDATGYSAVARHFGSDGQPTPGASLVVLAESIQPLGGFALSWNGSDSVLVLWSDPSALRSRVVSDLPGGALSTPLLVSTKARATTAAWNGSSHVVLWHQENSPELVGVRIDASGALLSEIGDHQATDPAAGQRYDLQLVARQGSLLLTWLDDRNPDYWRYDRFSRVLDLNGDPMGSPQLLGPEKDRAAIAAGSAATLLVRSMNGPSYRESNSSRISTGLQLVALGVDGLPISDAPFLFGASASQSGLALGRKDDGYLLVWSEFLSPLKKTIKASRLDAEGTPLDGQPIEIALGENPFDGTALWTGTQWAVVWVEGSDLYRSGGRLHGRYISANGNVSAPWSTPAPASGYLQYEPSLLPNAGEIALTWREGWASPARLFRATVDSGGLAAPVTSVDVPNCTAGVRQDRAASALLTCMTWGASLQIRHVHFDGRPPDSWAVLPVNVPWETDVSLSSNGKTTLLAAVGEHPGGRRLVVALLNEAGVVVSQPVIPTRAAYVYEPLTYWDGAQFILVWKEGSYDGSTTYTLRLSASGEVLEPVPTELGQRLYGHGLSFSSQGRGLFTFHAPRERHTDFAWRMIELDRAPLVSDQHLGLDEDGRVSFTLSAIDPDGDPLALRIIESPKHGAVIGSIPNLTYVPRADFNGTDELVFEAVAAKIKSSARVTFAVAPVDDPPIALPGTLTLAEDSIAALALEVVEVDGDLLTWEIVVAPGQGTLTGSPPELTYTPSPDFHGRDAFTFSVSDGNTTSTADFQIDVTSVDDLPILIPLDPVTLREGEPFTLAVHASDADGDPITLIGRDLPTGAMLEDGTFTWTPSYSQAGQYPISISVVDTEVRDTKSFIITVLNVNRAPVLEFPGPREIVVGRELNFRVRASDEDKQAVTISAEALPPGAHFDASIGAFRWLPREEHVGMHTLRFAAFDGETTAQATVGVRVIGSETPQPPTPPKAQPVGCSSSGAGSSALSFLMMGLTLWLAGARPESKTPSARSR